MSTRSTRSAGPAPVAPTLPARRRTRIPLVVQGGLSRVAQNFLAQQTARYVVTRGGIKYVPQTRTGALGAPAFAVRKGVVSQSLLMQIRQGKLEPPPDTPEFAVLRQTLHGMNVLDGQRTYTVRDYSDRTVAIPTSVWRSAPGLRVAASDSYEITPGGAPVRVRNWNPAQLPQTRRLLKWQKTAFVDMRRHRDNADPVHPLRAPRSERREGEPNWLSLRLQVMQDGFDQLWPAVENIVAESTETQRVRVFCEFMNGYGEDLWADTNTFGEAFSATTYAESRTRFRQAGARLLDHFQRYINELPSGESVTDIFVLECGISANPQPYSGGNYKATPTCIQQHVINVNNGTAQQNNNKKVVAYNTAQQNNDCFLWALAAHMASMAGALPDGKDRVARAERSSMASYAPYYEKVATQLTHVSFPVDVSDAMLIHQISDVLHFEIVTLQWLEDEECAKPLVLARQPCANACYLLLLHNDDGDGHIVYVRNPSRVLNRVSLNRNKLAELSVICPCCLGRNRTGEVHTCTDTTTQSPVWGGAVPLLQALPSDYACTVGKPVFITLADAYNNNSVCGGFLLTLHCGHILRDTLLNTIDDQCNTLVRDAAELWRRLDIIRASYAAMCVLHKDITKCKQWAVGASHDKSVCYLCKKPIDKSPHLDHCHITGLLLGWTHPLCNLARTTGALPVVCIGRAQMVMADLLEVAPSNSVVVPLTSRLDGNEAGIISLTLRGTGNSYKNDGSVRLVSLKRLGYDLKETINQQEDVLEYLRLQEKKGAAQLLKHRAACMAAFGSDPLHKASLPSYAYSTAMRLSGAVLEPAPAAMLTDIQRCFAAGICGSVLRRFSLQETPSMVCGEFDLRASYLACMRQPMPVGNWRRLDNVHVGMQLEPPGQLLFVCFDAHVPEDKHDTLWQMPGFPERRAVDAKWVPPGVVYDKNSTAALQHLYPRIKYWATGTELAYQLQRGWVLDAIHEAIACDTAPVFLPYAELIRSQREKAKANNNEADYLVAKLMGNSFAGQNALREDMFHSTRVLRTPQALKISLRNPDTVIHALRHASDTPEEDVWLVEPTSGSSHSGAATSQMDGFVDSQQHKLRAIVYGACRRIKDVHAHLQAVTDVDIRRQLLAKMEQDVLAAKRAALGYTPETLVREKLLPKTLELVKHYNFNCTVDVKRKLLYQNIFFLRDVIRAELPEDEAGRVQLLGVHQLRVDLRDTDHARLTTLQEWAAKGFLKLAPYIYEGMGYAMVPRSKAAPPTRSYAVFAAIVSFGRVALMKACDRITHAGGTLMNVDTDGGRFVIPRVQCTDDLGSGPHLPFDNGDIGMTKLENSQPIVEAWSLGNKSHGCLYADGTSKTCASGFPMKLTVEQYRGALEYRTLAPVEWQTLQRNPKQMSRSIHLSAAGGVLMGCGDTPLSWLPFGHKDLLKLLENENNDGPPPAKRSNVFGF